MPVATFSERNVWVYEGPTGNCIAGFRQRGTTLNRETYFYMSICITNPEPGTYALVASQNQKFDTACNWSPSRKWCCGPEGSDWFYYCFAGRLDVDYCSSRGSGNTCVMRTSSSWCQITDYCAYVHISYFLHFPNHHSEGRNS